MDKKIFILGIIVIALISSTIFVASQGSVFATDLQQSGSTGTSLTSSSGSTETCRDRLEALDLRCDSNSCWAALETPSGDQVGEVSSVGNINGVNCPASGTATIRITNPDAIGAQLSDQFVITVIPFAEAVRGATEGAEHIVSATQAEHQISSVGKGDYIFITPYFEEQ